MSAWSQIIFFDDEDADALKAEFIRLCALYIHRGWSHYDVAAEVFRGLREPVARSMQAAQIWGSSIEIAEQIRLASVRQGDGDKLEETLWAIADDDRNQTKDRLKALDQIAEITARKSKAIEFKNKDGSSILPSIVIVNPIKDDDDKS